MVHRCAHMRTILHHFAGDGTGGVAGTPTRTPGHALADPVRRTGQCPLVGTSVEANRVHAVVVIVARPVGRGCALALLAGAVTSGSR